jgi:allantoinase
MHFPEERIEDLKTALSQAVSDAIEHGQSNINVSLGNETGRWDKAWGGIASLGLALPVLWTGMKQRGIGLERIGEWMAAAPARLAGMNGRKGVIAVDADADFAVFDPEVKWTVASSDLYFRHKLSPYLGVELQGRVLETWLRGAPVFRAGAHLGKARGKEQVRS